MPTNVQIKWNKQVFDDVNIEGLQTGLELKKKVQELTGVPVDRQKVMGLGAGILKDDANLTNLKVKNGQVIRLMGSAEEIPEAPKDKPVFVEDLLSKGSSDETAIQFYPSGLENLQNTCYMNASLEMLRYVPELKNAVVNFDGTNVSELYEKDKTLTRELKTLYSQLENTNDSIAPMQFLNALRTAYPQFAEKEQTELGPVYSQQDADEFLGNLLSSLENMLKVKDENVIQKLFEGEFDVKLQCTECEEEAIHSKEKFKKLSCFISQQINNLPYGLQKSLETTLEKESPTLGKTALYSKIQRISKLPNYLLVNFVRFYWKQKEQVKAKILREVQFPFSLDVFDLCSEEYQKELKETREKWRQLREEEMKKKKEETLTGQVTKKLKTVNESSSSSQQQEEELIPIDQVEDSGWFELCGVVTHKGRTSNSGHYVGWVKDDKGRWLEFDDDDVTQVSEEDIKKLSGGGDWHCAYMLLYRKCRTAP